MEFEDSRPIFLQLAEMLEDAILSGVYREEDQVPSITEYSVAFKINPATALKGINLLVDADLRYKKRGVGMFVAPGAKEKLLQKRRGKFYENRLLPLVREAQALGLSPKELEDMMKRGMNDGN
jgi:DNA-binding transcriptional regulator YhcF (GntR family)